METLCRIPRFFGSVAEYLGYLFESYSLDFGVIFLDYTNISRKGGGVQKHNLSLYTDLVFRKQAERLAD